MVGMVSSLLCGIWGRGAISVLRRNAAGGGDESAELGGVFPAGREFDSGDDIDAAGIEEADGVGDVRGGEAAGDDYGCVLLDALHERKHGAPVEGLAGASAIAGDAGVEEDAVVAGALGEVGVEQFGIG